MELSRLLQSLVEPSAYPFLVEDVEVRQTHISAVFLAGNYVYKVKKPVDYGFLDFGTLEKRRYYCDEEVRLNRRLAPDVYLGVVPVTLSGEGLCFEGDGEPIEWAVKMRRLPDAATLQSRLQRGIVDADQIRSLARRIATFHAAAESGQRISALARFDVVAGNARENFDQTVDHVGISVNQSVWDRVRSLTEARLHKLRPLIESRAERGVARDTHGDLRLGHVYIFPDREPPDDLVVIDCIEFTERFRFADPIADMAFLLMGLNLNGERDLSREFLETYIDSSDDEEGRMLVPFYTAYRAVVRGKVEGLKLARSEILDADRHVAMTKARGSWLVALDELEEPNLRPCLILVTGLPGTGKSTLAHLLAADAHLDVIRSDVIRKELAEEESGVTRRGDHHATLGFGEGLYTPEWSKRTYAECLRRSEQLLLDGKRVVVDANFRDEASRRLFMDAATKLGVRVAVLVCQADPDVIRARLANRRDDASDADWSVYLNAAESWEDLGVRTQAVTQIVDTGQSTRHALAHAMDALRGWNLVA